VETRIYAQNFVSLILVVR